MAFRNTIDHPVKDKDVYTEHQNNKQKSKDIKDTKAESTIPEKKTSCSFDIQKIFLCPYGQKSSVNNKRRLGVFNFTILGYEESDGFSFIWPEHEVLRGPNEVLTGQFEYIREQASEGVKQNEMFSDTCG